MLDGGDADESGGGGLVAGDSETGDVEASGLGVGGGIEGGEVELQGELPGKGLAGGRCFDGEEAPAMMSGSPA